ncbi:hypothetical protein HZC21_00050 [Candidatus Peregrinibacteria bacterium]|nr:hypothetical protein [Candidatus Peregrinibacteria bacterium]
MNRRLDIYLTKKLKDFSRSLCQKFIRGAGVEINGSLIKKPNFLVREKDEVKFSIEKFREFIASLKPAVSDFKILKKNVIYDGKTFFVINKMPFIRSEEIINGFFSVHRLDKDTSGVLVIAKNIVTQARLQKQWHDRIVKKTYVALIKGILKPSKGAISAGISRSAKNRRKMAVSSSNFSRQSFTEYETIKYFDNCSLLKVFPRTGRTHQIRVHFASIGYPVIGDKIYGDKQLNKKFERQFGLKRQFLHASELEIIHPSTKKRLVFRSPLASDLKAVLKRF